MEKLDNITVLKLRTMQRAEKDKRRHVKITTLLMLDGGFRPEDIAYAFGIDVSTVYRYIERYDSSATLDEYLQDNYTGCDANLTPEQLTELEAELKTRLYTSAKEICAYIRQRFSMSYTPSGLVPLLKRIGFVYKKTRQVPAKADATEQAAFLEQLDDLLDAAEQGDSLYFADATHPQHNTRSSNGWIKSGEDFIIKSTSGRHRLNINGAINALDVTKLVVRTDERIDSESAIKLFKELQRRHRTGLIHVICDNARYYRSKAVRKALENSRIRLVFLPGYSPNLNLIERLWKYMHKKVIDPIYYPTKEAFRAAVLDFFADIRQHKLALESLLTLNFRVLSSSQSV